MKKTIVLFLLTLLMVPFLLSSKGVKASSINDLSYAKGTNLADPTNFARVGTTREIKSTKNIYARYTDENFAVQIPYSYLDNNGSVIESTVYDIDGAVIYESGLIPNTSKTVDSIDYAIYVGYVPEGGFSFSVSLIDIKNSYITDDFPSFMISFGGSYTQFEEFEESDGVFDLSNSTVPTIEVSYDNPLTVANIRTMVSSYDGYDGDLTNIMTIDAATYLATPSTVGTYQINCSVTDNAGNSQTGAFYIKVYDKIAPTIVGANTVSFPVYSELSDQDILDCFTISDGCDGTDITVTISEHTVNPSALITENVTITATDKSGNTATKTVTIKTIDNIAPVFTGTSDLTVSYQVNLTIQKIVESYVTISDTFDPNPTYTVSDDTFSGHGRILGTYSFLITAKDASNNTSSKTITITVTDTIKPVIYISSYIIETLPNVALSRNDLDNILLAAKELKKGKKYTATILVDTYTGHENEKGTYVYQVEYTDEDGESFEKTLSIIVSGDAYTFETIESIEAASKTKPWIIIGSIASSLVVLSVSITIIVIRKKRKILI